MTPPATAPIRPRLGMGFLAAVGWIVFALGLEFLMLLPLTRTAGTLDLEYYLKARTFARTVSVAIVVRAALGTVVCRPLAVRGPSVGHVGWVLVLVFPLVACANALGVLTSFGYEALGVWDWVLALRVEYRVSAVASADPSWVGVVVALVAVAVTPGVTEEILFRGVIGRGLVARFGLVWGIVLTSLLFGLVHRDPVNSVVCFGYGVVFHLVYLWTKSLFAPMLLHAANNAVLYLLWQVVYSLDSDIGAYVIPVGTISTGVIASGLLLAVLARTRTRWRLPDGSDWWCGYTTAETPPADADARPEHDADGRLGWAALAAVVVFAATTIVRL